MACALARLHITRIYTLSPEQRGSALRVPERFKPHQRSEYTSSLGIQHEVISLKDSTPSFWPKHWELRDQLPRSPPGVLSSRQPALPHLLLQRVLLRAGLRQLSLRPTGVAICIMASGKFHALCSAGRLEIEQWGINWHLPNVMSNNIRTPRQQTNARSTQGAREATRFFDICDFSIFYAVFSLWIFYAWSCWWTLGSAVLIGQLQPTLWIFPSAKIHSALPESLPTSENDAYSGKQ